MTLRAAPAYLIAGGWPTPESSERRNDEAHTASPARQAARPQTAAANQAASPKSITRRERRPARRRRRAAVRRLRRREPRRPGSRNPKSARRLRSPALRYGAVPWLPPRLRRAAARPTALSGARVASPARARGRARRADRG